jgi:hypothetical protein
VDLRDAAHIAGVLILLVSGLLTLFLPLVLASLVGFNVEQRGKAEIRVNFGGFWTGLGIAALLMPQPVVYQVLGIGWLAIVLARIFAYVIDRPKLDATYLLLLFGEALTALLLLA